MKAQQSPQAIYFTTEHCKTKFKVTAYRRQLVFSLWRNRFGLSIVCGFFGFLHALAKGPFGELSMRVGALWNWHDEPTKWPPIFFCL